MLLPRRGEFFYMGRCQWLMGFALSGRGGCEAGRLGICVLGILGIENR